MKLSGFADEISADLDEQVRVLNEENIRFVELRGVWNKNVAVLDKADVDRIKDTLKAGEIGVSAIGSPIGKTGIEEPHGPHFDTFRRILDIAVELNSPYIRLFSFYLPQNADPAHYRNQILDRFHTMLEAAEGSGVMLLHENETGIYGDTAERCLDLIEAVNHPGFRAIFDPANFIQRKQKPFTHCYPLLKEHIEYCHIKDAIMETGQVVPAGEGDGEVPELMQALQKKGYSGFLSLEPHLQEAGRAGGFSGPELFKKASQALKSILERLDIVYS